jgi:uncharacterized protein YjbJ (UPF0337 family)
LSRRKGAKLREKAQGRTKQAFGQMIGDDELVREGKKQEKRAERQSERKNDDSKSRFKSPPRGTSSRAGF